MAVKKTRIPGLTIDQCWKTSDGEIFSTLEEAKDHQIRYNFCVRLGVHLNKLDLTDHDKAVVTDAIMENLNGMAYLFELYNEERNADA